MLLCYENQASVSDKAIMVDSYPQIRLFSKNVDDYLIRILSLPRVFFIIDSGSVGYFISKEVGKGCYIKTTNKSGIYIP